MHARLVMTALCGALLASVATAAGKTWNGAAFGEAEKFGTAVRSGMALALEGDYLYGGAGDQLYVFDVTDPLKPVELGAVSGIGGARQVAVQKGIAYVTAREYGLWIVDCTNPRKPRIRSRFDTCELATGVDVAGDVCFCGQRQNGVEFIDVSDPDHPRHIAMRKTGESQSVKYRDGWLYSGEWGWGHVTVFDAHDMRAIREVKLIDLYGYGDGVWLQGDYLFAARGHHSKHRKVEGGVMTAEMKRFGGPVTGGGMGHGLDIFDVTDPADPKRVGALDYPPFYARGLDMWTPRTSGDLLVAAQTHNGVFAVDISDKTAPKTLDRWTFPVEERPDWPGACVGSVAIGDGVVYVAVNHKGGGFFALPCKRAKRETFVQGRLPKNASFREGYAADTAAWHVWKPKDVGQCRAVAVKGDVAYVACGDAGLYALRILPGNAGFRELGKFPGHERVFDVSVLGERLYTAEGQDGIAIYDVSGDPAAFREVARLPRIMSWKSLALCATAVSEKWLFCGDRHGIDLFDISALPTFRHVFSTGGCPGWDKYLADRPVGNGRYMAYNAAHTSVKWIDLEAKPEPELSVDTKVNRIGLCNGLCAFRDDLSIVSNGGGYRLLRPNEGDPADGTKWRFADLPEAFDGKDRLINGIPRSDGRRVVFTSRIHRRAALYDFADAENPKLLAAWKFRGNPDLAQFHDGKVLIPCGYEGLLLQK